MPYSSSDEKSIPHSLGMNLFTDLDRAAARIRLSCAACTSAVGGLSVEMTVSIELLSKSLDSASMLS